MAKCQPGDVVHFYYDQRRATPSNTVTAHIRSAIVAGRYGLKHDVTLLLGSEDPTLGFWSMRDEMKYPDDTFSAYRCAKWDRAIIKKFPYGYWAYNYDLRIAKIELVGR